MIKILKFLRLADENNVLSITNIFMFIMMYKIYSTPALSMHDISVVFIAIANYSYKKKLNKDQDV